MYRLLHTDFEIPSELKELFDNFMTDINCNIGEPLEYYEKKIADLLEKYSPPLTKEQADILRSYYCEGGFYGSDTKNMEPRTEENRKLYEYIKQRGLRPYAIDDAREFLVDKEIFLATGDLDWLQNAYQSLFCSLKAQWVNGIISENEFWELVGRFKEGI